MIWNFCNIILCARARASYSPEKFRADVRTCMLFGGGRARALSAVGCYFFVGGSSTCLVCCRLLFLWVEGVCFQPPNFLRWCNFPKFSFPRWYFENFLNHAPNFIFPVGISRIFSYFPRWYLENFLNHVQNFLFVFRFVNTKALDLRIGSAHTDRHTKGKNFIFGLMVYFRILIYTYVHTHDPIRMAPPRRGQSANASCPRLVSAR